MFRHLVAGQTKQGSKKSLILALELEHDAGDDACLLCWGIEYGRVARIMLMALPLLIMVMICVYR